MTGPAQPQWLEQCLAEQIDPNEVNLVLQRYEAYRRYYHQAGRGQPLPLAEWFNWYRIEAATEASASTPSPSGCSVDADSHSRGAIRKPQVFLKMLASLAASRDPL